MGDLKKKKKKEKQKERKKIKGRRVLARLAVSGG